MKALIEIVEATGKCNGIEGEPKKKHNNNKNKEENERKNTQKKTKNKIVKK